MFASHFTFRAKAAVIVAPDRDRTDLEFVIGGMSGGVYHEFVCFVADDHLPRLDEVLLQLRVTHWVQLEGYPNEERICVTELTQIHKSATLSVEEIRAIHFGIHKRKGRSELLKQILR